MTRQTALLAIALGACGPGSTQADGATAFNACDSDGGGVLCGFEVTSGSVTTVQAFTAGEHALELQPGTVLEHRLGWGDCVVPVLRGIARCDVGGRLVYEEIFRGTVVSTATALPGTDWEHVGLALPNPVLPRSSQTPLVRLRFSNPGSALCEISEIASDGMIGLPYSCR